MFTLKWLLRRCRIKDFRTWHSNLDETEKVKTKTLISMVGGTGFEPVTPAV
jgi:hypothetical protein